MDEGERALAKVGRQRKAMAARIRMPVWFRVVFALAWSGFLAAPALMLEHERLGLGDFPYLPVSFLGLAVAVMGFRHMSALGQSSLVPDYPSLRRLGPQTAALFLGGAAFAWVPAVAGLPYVAIVIALVVGGLASAQACRLNAAIRHDVANGFPVPEGH
ncbi:hypothetical protein GCM10022243_26930 [Saccharothrix violaceirubra]|uniref:Uncharacterized protein n=1 Tax=Saccharothrix violaceirubra TaxID=413306 RepID=A0A7W7TA84_9PSEU|nr:hypothetical protein [Saccharothrix violaceirubra]MBB4969385.1 hypothetical protein [Saccharothrix violaceirubra]